MPESQVSIQLVSGPVERVPSWKEKAGRQARIIWYGIVSWLRAPGTTVEILQLGGSFWLLAFPLIKIGWPHSFWGTVVWVGIAGIKIRKSLAPTAMARIKQDKLARQFEMLKLVERMQKILGSVGPVGQEELAEYRRDVLALIASYVRTHRADHRGNVIFANLLTEHAGVWQVVARDQRHRMNSQAVGKSDALSYIAYATGKAQLTGNIYVDFPKTPSGKPYNSIIAIPVFSGSRPADSGPVGVVTVDSSRLYHFDVYFEDLVHDLAPYVALLGWTVDIPPAKKLFSQSRSTVVRSRKKQRGGP